MPPIYEFQCPSCQDIKEEIGTSSKETIIMTCNNCLINMKKIISSSNGRVKNGTPKFHNNN